MAKYVTGTLTTSQLSEAAFLRLQERPDSDSAGLIFKYIGAHRRTKQGRL